MLLGGCVTNLWIKPKTNSNHSNQNNQILIHSTEYEVCMIINQMRINIKYSIFIGIKYLDPVILTIIKSYLHVHMLFINEYFNNYC